jgi:hypothetical protein
MDGLLIFEEILGILGYLVRFLGFLLIGYGAARFVLESYQKAAWQLQIALVLGFFGLLIGLTAFTSAGSAGAFALGAGFSFFRAFMPVKEKDGEKEGQEKKNKN